MNKYLILITICLSWSIIFIGCHKNDAKNFGDNNSNHPRILSDWNPSHFLDVAEMTMGIAIGYDWLYNDLTIDDEHQMVDGYAKIDRYSEDDNFPFAVSETTTVYKSQLRKAARGIGIIDKKYVVVRDELESLNKTTIVRWAMFTFASVVLGNNEAILTKDGKTLYLKVKGPGNIIMKEWSTMPTNNYDATNPGTILVGFECELPPNSVQSMEVLLIPGNENASATFLDKSLADW